MPADRSQRMQLSLELGIELVAYIGGRRVVLDTLDPESLRARLVNEQHWRPAIARVVALHKFNIKQMPMDDAILAAYESKLINYASVAPLFERSVGR